MVLDSLGGDYVPSRYVWHIEELLDLCYIRNTHLSYYMHSWWIEDMVRGLASQC